MSEFFPEIEPDNLNMTPVRSSSAPSASEVATLAPPLTEAVPQTSLPRALVTAQAAGKTEIRSVNVGGWQALDDAYVKRIENTPGAEDANGFMLHGNAIYTAPDQPAYVLRSAPAPEEPTFGERLASEMREVRDEVYAGANTAMSGAGGLLPDIAKNALAYTASIVSAPRIAADLGAERVFGVTPSAWIDEKVSAVGSGMATAAKYVVDHAGEVAKPVPVQPPEPKIPPSLPVGAYIEDHVAPQRTTEERLDLLERAMEVSPREPAPQPGPAGKTPAASPTLKVHSLEE